MIEPAPLTITEALERLGGMVSRRTLQRAAADGRVRSVRVGREYRIPPAEVARIRAEGIPPEPEHRLGVIAR